MSNRDANNVNYFGGIPSNWDDSLYVKSAPIGIGTDRPVGFTFDTMHFMYWNVRYFKYSIGGLIQTDYFSTFLAGGGASGSIIGSTAGLAAVGASAGKKNSFGASGKTRSSFLSRVRNRVNDNKLALQNKQLDDYNFATAPNNPVAENVIHYNRSSFKKKTVDKKDVFVPQGFNEGCLPGGVIHSGYASDVMVYIDFSSIVYHKYLYYPIVIVQTPFGSSVIFKPSYSIKDGNRTINLSTGLLQSPFSFVVFNGALINMFVYDPGIFSSVYIQGYINVPQSKDCCSRFYYDGKDEERAKKAKEEGCSDCETLGVGEKSPY
jgi:hypothetical protein